jgi:hypothetical protein
MPNPVKNLKSLRGLSTRQKAIVARVRKAGLTPKGYHRAKYAGRKTKSSTTVHDPFLDIKRRAKVSKDVKYVERYPQARDTMMQSNTRYVRRVRVGRKAHGAHKKSLLRSLLYP